MVARLVCDKHRGREIGTIRVDRSSRANVVLVTSPWHRSIHHPEGPMRRAMTARKVTVLADFTGGRALCRRCGWLDVSADVVAAALDNGTPRHPATVPIPVRTTL